MTRRRMGCLEMCAIGFALGLLLFVAFFAALPLINKMLERI